MFRVFDRLDKQRRTYALGIPAGEYPVSFRHPDSTSREDTREHLVGHPIIFDPSLLDEMLSINEETQGIKAVVQRHAELTLRLEMNDPEVLWDLNTPEQYEAAHTRHSE